MYIIFREILDFSGVNRSSQRGHNGPSGGTRLGLMKCNVALVQTIKDRVATGENVYAVCKDLEDFQRQLHGEIYYSKQSLMGRYRHMMGLTKGGANLGDSQKGGRPLKYQKESEKPSALAEKIVYEKWARRSFFPRRPSTLWENNGPK